MIVLAVDPGEKNIGLALSDPTGTIANPLVVIKHISRPRDATAITQVAVERGAACIVVGQALDENGQPTYTGRRALRLAAAIRTQTDIPVVLWDESSSTATARAARVAMGVSRNKRRGHLDKLAATVILQSYLDVHIPKKP